MRVVRLTPNFRPWIAFGTTAALVVLGLTALFLAEGLRRPPALPASEGIAAAQASLTAGDFYPEQDPEPEQNPVASLPSTGWQAGPWQGPAPGSTNNLPVLAIGSAMALAMAGGAVLLPRQRRFRGLAVSSGKVHMPHQTISPSPSV
jgi:hypothetical protein